MADSYLLGRRHVTPPRKARKDTKATKGFLTFFVMFRVFRGGRHGVASQSGVVRGGQTGLEPAARSLESSR